jgi:anaerobic selenocysteine-containing dehydrogenase
MHSKTAAEKGIKDGDEVWVENPEGKKIKGWITLSE